MTHTYAVLEVSPSTYEEIARGLHEAEYHHSFDRDVIDMHGIALRAKNAERLTANQLDALRLDALTMLSNACPKNCGPLARVWKHVESGDLWLVRFISFDEGSLDRRVNYSPIINGLPTEIVFGRPIAEFLLRFEAQD